MRRFRWGILGTGTVSARFAAGLAAARNAEIAFIASRDLARAEAFAAGVGIARAIADYRDAVAQGGVDAIYIATPPALHSTHALMCIEAGFPVLVEKPLATTAVEAKTIASAAQARGVFAMEAMWTRFLPAMQALKNKVAARAVGEARFVTGSFGISESPDPANGLFDPALGGGALAHLGAYPLSLGQWLFGTPTLTQATGTIGTTGVDEDAAIQLAYPGETIGSFLVSLRAWAPDDFNILGTDGRIAVEGPMVRPHGLRVASQRPRAPSGASFDWTVRLREHGLAHRLKQLRGHGGGRRIKLHYAGNGYHYEADEVRACIEGGLLESAIMPLGDSIAVARTIDAIRAEILKRKTPPG